MTRESSLPVPATGTVYLSYGEQNVTHQNQSMSKPSGQKDRSLYRTSQPRSHREPGLPEPRAQLNEVQGEATVLAHHASQPSSTKRYPAMYRYSAWQTGPALETLPRPASALNSRNTHNTADTLLQNGAPLPTFSPRPSPAQKARESWQRQFVEEQLRCTLLELASILSLDAINQPLANVRPAVNQYRSAALVLWMHMTVSDLKGKTFSVHDLSPTYIFDHWAKSLLLTRAELNIVEKELALLSAKCGLQAH